MATRVEGLAPGAVPAVPAREGNPARAARRSRRQLLPGLLLACAYASGLALARAVDVSADGKGMLAFGSTFSLAVLFSAVARPRWYLPLAVAYLPFSRAYPLPVAGVTGANMTNLLLVVGLFAWLARTVGGRPRLRVGGLEVLAALYVLVGSLGVLPAYLAGHGVVEVALTYREWLAPILFFFLARGLVRDRQDVAGILQVLAWTTFLVAADTWREGLERAGRGSIERSRVPGLMEQANSMGAFLAYYGVAFLAAAATARSWRSRLPHLVAFLVAARVTLYTFSRGAYLALAAGSSSVLLLAHPLVLVAAGGGGIVALGFFPSALPESVRARLGGTPLGRTGDAFEDAGVTLDRSSALRLVLWRGAARIIAAHPLQGVGLGRFPEVVRGYTDQPLSRDDPADAHNAYLLVAAEQGIPCLALLLLLQAGWVLTALRLYRRRREPLDRRLALTFLGSFTAVLVSCLLGSRFSDETLIGYFWILAALLVVTARLPASRLSASRAR